MYLFTLLGLLSEKKICLLEVENHPRKHRQGHMSLQATENRVIFLVIAFTALTVIISHTTVGIYPGGPITHSVRHAPCSALLGPLLGALTESSSLGSGPQVPPQKQKAAFLSEVMT